MVYIGIAWEACLLRFSKNINLDGSDESLFELAPSRTLHWRDKLMDIVGHFRSHSARATARHLARSTARKTDGLAWNWVVPALWPVLLGFVSILGSITKSRAPKVGPPTTVVMLVHDPTERRKFPTIGPDMTERLSGWISEQIPEARVAYQSTLEGRELGNQTVLVIANYDWLVRLTNPVRTVLRETLIARKKNYKIIAAPIDLWGPKLNLLASILVALTDGHTLVASNDGSQATRFYLPRPWGPVLWIWPQAEAERWASAPHWRAKENVALVATGGDVRRPAHFLPLAQKLGELGFEVIETKRSLEWEEYVRLVKKSKLIFTTCEIQPNFFVGPRYFQRLIPDGHVTMRVWEGFATGATVFTNEISALGLMGFSPGQHYVKTPNFGDDWSQWGIPDNQTLESVASEGHARFTEMVGAACLPPHYV